MAPAAADDWANELAVPAVPVASTTTTTAGFDEAAPPATDDWAATDTGDWATAQPTPAAPAPAAPQPTSDWGGSSAENWG